MIICFALLQLAIAVLFVAYNWVVIATGRVEWFPFILGIMWITWSIHFACLLVSNLLYQD